MWHSPSALGRLTLLAGGLPVAAIMAGSSIGPVAFVELGIPFHE